MQRFHRRALVGLALSLSACQGSPALVPGLGTGAVAPAGASAQGAVTIPPAAVVSPVSGPRAVGGHSMVLTIQWPARRTQGVLAETDLLVLHTEEFVAGKSRPGKDITFERPAAGEPVKKEYVLQFAAEVDEVEVAVEAFANDSIKGRILKGKGAGRERLRRDTPAALRITLSAVGAPIVVPDTQERVLRSLEGHYARKYAHLVNVGNSPEAGAFSMAAEDLMQKLVAGFAPEAPPASSDIPIVENPGIPTISSLGQWLQILDVPPEPVAGSEPPALGGAPQPIEGALPSSDRFPAFPEPLQGIPLPGLKNYPDTRVVLDPSRDDRLRGLDFPGYMARIDGMRTETQNGVGRSGDLKLDLRAGSGGIPRSSGLNAHVELNATSGAWNPTGLPDRVAIPGASASAAIPYLVDGPDLARVAAAGASFWMSPGSMPEATVSFGFQLSRFAPIPADLQGLLPGGTFGGFSFDGIRVPLALEGHVESPWARIQGKTAISIDNSFVDSSGELAVRDASGKFDPYPYRVGLDWSLANLRSGEGVQLQMRMDDVANGFGIRAQLVARGGGSPPDIVATLVDSQTEKRLGRIEFSLEYPLGSTRLRDYPLLILEPLKEGEEPIRYRLTPGFFSGDRTGALYVEVR